MSERAELIRALGVLTEAPGPEHRRLAELLELGGAPDAEGYAHTFRLQLYPYAAVYAGPEGMMGGEASDRAAGAWRALGRTPPAEPDHLGALLGLYAALCEQAEKERDQAERALWETAAAGFLWEHLLSWAMPYLDRFEEIGTPVYRAWARLLAITLRGEARRWGPPALLPLHLRCAPEVPDPRECGADAFLSGLLAPVRSGLLLTRADLARGATATGLGLRMGERRFALRAFFSQDAGGTLDWLRDEADAAFRRHGTWSDDMQAVADFWSARARATRKLVSSLRESGAGGFEEMDAVTQASEVVDARD